MPLIAQASLVLLLLAVLCALGITLLHVPAGVAWLASALVIPFVGVTVLVLHFESRGYRWSFLAAAALGVFGIALRLLINTQPQLEVGGGLPVWVTILYIGIASFEVASSLGSLVAHRRAPASATRL